MGGNAIAERSPPLPPVFCVREGTGEAQGREASDEDEEFHSESSRGSLLIANAGRRSKENHVEFNSWRFCHGFLLNGAMTLLAYPWKGFKIPKK